MPVVAVLGNHDLHSDQGQDAVTDELTNAGVTVLEGRIVDLTLDIDGRRVGIAGVPEDSVADSEGACASAFGEPEMKHFVGTTTVASAPG